MEKLPIHLRALLEWIYEHSRSNILSELQLRGEIEIERIARRNDDSWRLRRLARHGRHKNANFFIFVWWIEIATGADRKQQKSTSDKHNQADEGTSILLIEQQLAFALQYADVIYIMNKGRIVYRCTSAELKGDAQIKARYLGV